jgi:aspartyl aminopeptidase
MAKDELKKVAWTHMDEARQKQALEFAAGYKNFLTAAKTERETNAYILEAAKKRGFKAISEIQTLQAGQKIYFTYHGKACALAVIGKEPLEKGLNIIASHLDSPRVDLKANPLYEADGMVWFKTHYYGGIKKYQWVATPLSLHGVAAKKDGTTVTLALGEQPEENAFTITDLLPHLAKDQMEKKMSEAIEGEKLNLLIGSRPAAQEEDPFAAYIWQLLKEKYQLEAEDFASAELQLVPAYPARDIGFDGSMIGAYGQDDRICVYTSLQALFAIEAPEKTALCIFADKEEIGSVGNTGLQSLLMDSIFVDLLHRSGQDDYYSLRQAMIHSAALSADVNAAVDPNYADAFEKMNCSFLGRGVVMTKYTGARGKSDSNDAHPEYLAKLRKLFDDHDIVWQVGELGKVDIGGGGTVAKYMSYFGMEVVDCGPAILSMHSPFEVSSKADVYMAYSAYTKFFQML